MVMTKTQKVLGGSILSILLLTITLFSMCGIRMQRITDEGDLSFMDESEQQTQEEILDQLEFIGDEELNQAGSEGADTDLTALESVSSSETGSANPEESFLTPELMQNLQAEIADLERLYELKQRAADSLRHRQEEMNLGQLAQEGAEQTRRFEQETPLFAAKGPKMAEEIPRTRSLSAAGPVQDYTEFQLYYRDALDDYHTGKYRRAIQKFRKLLLRSDAGDLADNCQYWIGESYFALGDYYQAVVEFEKVYSWAGSNKISDAQLMVAIALLKAGETELARGEFDTLLSFFQNKSAAKKARKYIDMIDQV